MKTKLLAISFILFGKLFAQKITDNLEEANVLRTEDGIVVFGIVKEASKKSISVIRYGNDLKPIAQFKKEISEELLDEILCNKENQNFVFQCKSGRTGAFIRLDGKLNLLSYKEYGKDEFKIQRDKGYTPSPDIMSPQPFIAYYTKENLYNTGPNCIFSDTIAPGELWTTYKMKWGKDLGFTKNEINNVLAVSIKYVFIYVNDEMDKKSFNQYIICFDKKSGDIIYKTQLNPNYQKIIVPSNAIYNENKGELIIAGDYADIEKKNDIYKVDENGVNSSGFGFFINVFELDGIFLMKLANDGHVVNTTYENNSSYKIKNDVLPLNKYDVKAIFHKIIPLGNGEYLAIAEEACDANWLGLSEDEHAHGGMHYRPFGFSLIYFNDNLIITDNKFIEKIDFRKMNGLKYSHTFNSLDLTPLNQYPVYFYSNNDYIKKNYYSFNDCIYDEKEKNLILLYNNTILQGNLSLPNTLYYILKVKNKGEVSNDLIPNQVNGKNNSKVFLIDPRKGILFNSFPKEKSFSLEIINF
jgi:hypothetical protein